MDTRITTPFTADSTAAEVIAGIDLSGRRAIVTGGSSGIGVETARALAAAGAGVTLAVRDVVAAHAVATALIAGTGNERILVAPLDLADPSSVAAFVAGWEGPLHILINNAAVMGPPLTRTRQGWELQFATNHLGHFALATGLHGALAAAGGARVVSVASSGYMRSPVVFEDIHFERRPYEPLSGYGQSKTANVLFAVEAHRRWAGDGIAVNALHPGSIATRLQRHFDPAQVARYRTRYSAYIRPKTPEQGAATSVLLAASPLVEGVGGRYFEDCNEAGPTGPGNPPRGMAGNALDPEAAARLWRVSEAMLAGLPAGA